MDNSPYTLSVMVNQMTSRISVYNTCIIDVYWPVKLRICHQMWHISICHIPRVWIHPYCVVCGVLPLYIQQNVRTNWYTESPRWYRYNFPIAIMWYFCWPIHVYSWWVTRMFTSRPGYACIWLQCNIQSRNWIVDALHIIVVFGVYEMHYCIRKIHPHVY